MSQEQDPRLLIEQALAGDPTSVRILVDRFTPVITRRVAATLWRAGRQRNVAEDAGDMVQDVFLSLFEANGKALRAWDPERGMSLDNFVGLLAQHQVVSILRSGRTSPWREEPTDTDHFEQLSSPLGTPESLTSSREDLRVLLDRLRETLSPRGLQLFQRIIVEEEPLDEVAASTGLTRDAVYQWKSRLFRTIRAMATKMDAPVSETAAELRIVKGAPQS